MEDTIGTSLLLGAFGMIAVVGFALLFHRVLDVGVWVVELGISHPILFLLSGVGVLSGPLSFGAAALAFIALGLLLPLFLQMQFGGRFVMMQRLQ